MAELKRVVQVLADFDRSSFHKELLKEGLSIGVFTSKIEKVYKEKTNCNTVIEKVQVNSINFYD